MNNIHKIKMIPLEDLQTPKNGYRAMVGYYWIVNDGCAMSYHRLGNTESSGTPQCNMNKSVADSMQQRIYPDSEVVYVPVAYWEE